MDSRSHRSSESAGTGSVRSLLAKLAGLLLICYSGVVAAAEPRVSPPGLESMRAMALGLLVVGDYEGSIAAYQEIARHAPDDPKSHYDLAGTFCFLRMYAEAVEPIQTAIRLAPNDVRSYDLAALIFMSLSRYEEAFGATLESARLGESTAMFSLVNMYEQGLGVTANQDQAVYWAEQAADHGHLGAMAIMEEAYRTGRFDRRIDSKLADEWATRLRASE